MLHRALTRSSWPPLGWGTQKLMRRGRTVRHAARPWARLGCAHTGRVDGMCVATQASGAVSTVAGVGGAEPPLAVVHAAAAQVNVLLGIRGT